MPAMPSGELVESPARCGILFQRQAQVSGNGLFPRRAVQSKLDAADAANVGAGGLTQTRIELDGGGPLTQSGMEGEAAAPAASRHHGNARAASIHNRDDGHVFRLPWLAARVGRFARLACSVGFFAAKLRDQRVGNGCRHIDVAHHPDFVDRGLKFLCWRWHRSRIANFVGRVLLITLCAKIPRSRIRDASSKIAGAISVARGSASEKPSEPQDQDSNYLRCDTTVRICA